jgi:hypothetical protein
MCSVYAYIEAAAAVLRRSIACVYSSTWLPRSGEGRRNVRLFFVCEPEQQMWQKRVSWVVCTAATPATIPVLATTGTCCLHTTTCAACACVSINGV